MTSLNKPSTLPPVPRCTYVRNQKHGYAVYVENRYVGDVYKLRRFWIASQFIAIPENMVKKLNIDGFNSRKSAGNYLREIVKIEDIWTDRYWSKHELDVSRPYCHQ